MYEKKYQTRVLKQDKDLSSKKKIKFSWKRFFIIFAVIAFLTGIIFLIKYPRFQVTNVSVVGTSVVDNEEVSSQLKNELLGRVLWIFPRTSVFLINDKSLEKTIKSKFSRIESIGVKRTNLNSILVTIKEFDAEYLWCISPEENQDCYLMDKQGMVYSKSPVFSGSAYMKIFTGAPIDQMPFLGISYDNLERIAQIKKQLSDINIEPVSITLVSPRETRVDFIHNKNLSQLIIDPAVSVDTSLEYLFSGIRTSPLSTLFHDESKVLLYIDVRFPNKVVYKFQE